MVPAIKGADGLDFAAFHTYYEDLITKTRENKLTADDFQGTNISLTNPGGIGTVASVPRLMKRPERDHRHRLDRLPAGVGARLARTGCAQLGVSKVMTLTSTYDHRVIQGAESGAFLRRIEQLLQGEDGFYEAVAADLGIEAGADHRRPPRLGLGAAARRRRAAAPSRPRPSPTRSCCRRSRRRPRCSRATAPTATSPPASTRSAASRRATRRSSPRTST